MSRRIGFPLTVALFAAAGLGLLALESSDRAGATFPGKDGVIAFTRISDDPDGNGFCFSIYTATATGKDLTQLSGGCSIDEEPSWSADGKRIVFVQNERIFTMSKKGDDFEQLTQGNRFEGKKFSDHNPSWSPDGKRIVFGRAYGTRFSRILSVKPNGKGLRDLVTEPNDVYQSDPVYSPDGDFVAFAAIEADDKEAIYLVGADGTGLAAVTAPGKDVQDPDWAPNGERIVFSGQDGGFELFSVRPDSSGLNKLTNNTGDPFDPVYSPDGSRIAFANSGELSSIPADGGKPKVILKKGKVEAVDPSWQPK